MCFMKLTSISRQVNGFFFFKVLMTYLFRLILDKSGKKFLCISSVQSLACVVHIARDWFKVWNDKVNQIWN